MTVAVDVARTDTAARLMSMRRADWRFLLPPPAGERFDTMVVLGGPPALRGDLRQRSVARHISGTA